MSKLSLNQQLWNAVQDNDLQMVEAAIVAGADPDFRDAPSDPTSDRAPYGTHSVLHEAVSLGNTVAVQLLLRYGAEQTKDGVYGLTPLHLATLEGNLEITRLLLDNKADPKARCDTGDSVFMTALMGENPYINGVPWFYQKTENPEKLLPLLEMLIEAKVDINAPNDAGETPLWNVIRYQSVPVLEWMIAHGANIHQVTVFDTDLIAEAGLALSRADTWADIPERKREGGLMRRQVVELLTVLHDQGLAWKDIPEEEIVYQYPSHQVHMELKSMWGSLDRGPARPSRTASVTTQQMK